MHGNSDPSEECFVCPAELLLLFASFPAVLLLLLLLLLLARAIVAAAASVNRERNRSLQA